jgi:hypothetical protein
MFAHARRELYEDLLLSTRHLIFFGTPHQGTDPASLAGIVNGIANRVFGSEGGALTHLSHWSKPVLEANQNFVHVAEAFHFTTFVETQKYLGTLVSGAIVEH